MIVLNETQVIARLCAEVGARITDPDKAHRKAGELALDALSSLCIDLGTAPIATQIRGTHFCVTLTDYDGKVWAFAAVDMTRALANE